MTATLSARQLLQRLRLRQVALLLALRRLGTLRAAAEELGMTQPAASQMLQELEGVLGLALFERVGRGLRPTAAGEAVMAHCEGLEGSLQALARTLDGLREGEGGVLAVGCIPASSPTLLVRAVAQLKRERPLVKVRVVTETSDHLLDLLDAGELDLVIGRLTEGRAHGDYRSVVLASEPLSMVVGARNSRAQERNLSLAGLMNDPWVLQPRPSPMREVLEQEFRLHGLDTPRNLVETASMHTTVFLINEAPMVAVLPAALATRHAAEGLLAVLPLALEHGLEPYRAIVPRQRPLGVAARRFLELVEPGAVEAVRVDADLASAQRS
jgi:DNA-binding transcriptional LysR family regulator